MIRLRYNNPFTIAGALIFAGGIFFLIGLIAYDHHLDSIKEEKKNDLEIINHFKVQHFSVWLKERSEFGNAVLNNSFALRNFKKMIDDKSKEKEISDEYNLFDYYKNNFDYKNILLFNKNLELVYTSKSPNKVYISNIDKIINETTDTSLASVSPVYKNYQGELLSAVILPLKKNDLLYGWLLFETNPEDELNVFLNLSPGNLQTVETSIIFKKDSLVLFKSSSPKTLSHEFIFVLEKLDPLSYKALIQQTGSIEDRDYYGYESIGYVENIPGTNWYLISKIKIEEIYNQAEEYRNGIILILVLLMFATALTIIVVWRNAKLNFYKKEYELIKEKNLLLKNYDYLSRYANDMIFLLDEQGIIKQANEKALSVYGYTQEELYGSSGKILRPDELKSEYERILKSLGNDEGLLYETIHQKKNGEKFPVEISVRSFHVDGSRFIQAIIRDISERIIAEKELKEKEKRYKAVFNNANDAIFILEDYKIIECNSKTSDVFGYSKIELLGKRPFDFSPEFQRCNLRSEDEGIIKVDSALNGVPQFFEWKHLKAGETIINTEVALSRLDINGNKFVQCVVKDITEKKFAEEIIREHSIMLDAVGQAVIANKPDGEIIFWNKAAEKLYGWEKNEVIGKNIIDIIPSRISGDAAAEILRYLQDGKTWSGEFLVKKKDKTVFPAFVTDSPVYNSEGELVAVIGVSTDLTEQQKREEELLKAKENAEEINRIKSNFLANMSHELRTPLIAILGYAEMVLDEFTDSFIRERVGEIYKSGVRLNETLNTILDLSKIESEKIDVFLEKFNVKEIIEESVVLFKAVAEEKGLTLKYNCFTNGTMVEIDRQMFTRVINNLLSNAVKYTEKGEIKVLSKVEGNRLKIEIEDTGIGIPEDKHNLIFEPFRQVSEGYNRKFEGTGLGLTITKRLIELINGQIYLESTDKGSKFTIELPVNNDFSDRNGLVKKEEIITKMEKGEKGIRKINLLLVEDDDVNAKIISRFLDTYYYIDWVKTGTEALNFAQNKKYDCFLMDISLKGELDGLMTTAEIRKIPGYESTPIVAVTAFAMVGDKEKFLSGGCTHYISKPFTKQELLFILKKIFE